MRRLITGLAAIALLFAVAQPSVAGAREPDRVCGVEPGDGAFKYVAVWNVECGYARKIARRAGHKFCGDRFQRCNVDPGEFKSGAVDVRQWSCKMRVGYEYFRARCNKNGSDKRFLYRAGA